MKAFKAYMMSMAVCIGLAFATSAIAADKPSDNNSDKNIEFQINAGIGGAPGMAAFHGSVNGPPSTSLITEHLAARVRFPKYTPLMMEAGAVFLSGIGANLGVDVIHTERFRLHILDAGFLWNWFNDPVTVSNIKRPIDLVFGAGLDVKVTDIITVTLDWRVFMPPPWDILLKYGDFARPMLEESLKGGQIWIGISRVW